MAGQLEQKTTSGKSEFSIFASVKLTIVLLVLVAITVLVGAWCPQESQVGQEKVIEQFGRDLAVEFKRWGISDIFHTPWFLGLIGLLTINMIAGSVQRVFPKLKLLAVPLPFLSIEQIEKFPASRKLTLANTSKEQALAELAQAIKQAGYRVKVQDNKITAEHGKIGRLAPTVTHIGLLSLLAGVTITSWTGFNGFQPIPEGGSLTFESSEHSKLWIGKLPNWRVRVDSSYREDYKSGDVKQWYSKLTVIDNHGKEVKHQEISVNNPLSYEGVDIYQSSWGLDKLVLDFNGFPRIFDLRPMGKVNAAFLPLDAGTILIFSVKDQKSPLKIFAKTPQWQAPRLLTELPLNHAAKLGQVKVGYVKTIAISGLQYKSDPGLPITYVAFGFIMLGVTLTLFRYWKVWACVQEESPGNITICLGGIPHKGKMSFERNLDKIVSKLKQGVIIPPDSSNDSVSTDIQAQAQEQIANV